MEKVGHKMTKTEAKKIATHIMRESIGVAYYRIADSNDYAQEDKEVIIDYVNKLGKRACKAIGIDYVTY